jgi:hypothetical protein
VRYEGTEAVVRLAVHAGLSTVAGFERGFLARIDFGTDPAGRIAGEEYSADIGVAAVPLPGSALLLVMAGAACGCGSRSLGVAFSNLAIPRSGGCPIPGGGAVRRRGAARRLCRR